MTQYSVTRCGNFAPNWQFLKALGDEKNVCGVKVSDLEVLLGTQCGNLANENY